MPFLQPFLPALKLLRDFQVLYAMLIPLLNSMNNLHKMPLRHVLLRNFIRAADRRSSLVPGWGSPVAERFSSDVGFEERYQVFLKTKKISKAMQAYLTATRAKEDLFAKENAEFELGKRHLGNMMGFDPNTMTQDDIDESIRYLLPSGLFSPRSRPTMKPPSYHFAAVKAAEFSEDGRPFNDMFYTRKPKFYQHLYEVYEKIDKLDAFAESQSKIPENNQKEESNTSIILVGTTWLNEANLQQRFLEKVDGDNVKQFAAAMEYLVSHPYAYIERDFILNYRVSIAVNAASIVEAVKETKTDDTGRIYAEAEGKRKSCIAYVKVYSEGTGKFSIDGQNLLQFELPNSRETILHPFLVLDRFEQFDVVARTEGGGETGRAGAVRTAMCKALCPFISENEIEKLRIAGLLSRDIRRKERNKFQHIGARARPVWKKR